MRICFALSWMYLHSRQPYFTAPERILIFHIHDGPEAIKKKCTFALILSGDIITAISVTTLYIAFERKPEIQWYVLLQDAKEY